jgi:Holliday junction DNA helicase RuvA
MIASLRGTLLEKGVASCVLEAGGVGYLVAVSSHTLRALPDKGREVFLRTRQVVREDALMLFGFTDAEELKLFDLMIGVSGVGPKLALAVLSGMKPQALARAIRDEHLGALVAIPGIGRKTAERLVVELRDKLDVVAAPAGADEAEEPAKGRGVLPRSERFEDAVAALVRLGYTPVQAQDVVRSVAKSSEDLTLEDLVRRALGALGKAAAAR